MAMTCVNGCQECTGCMMCQTNPQWETEDDMAFLAERDEGRE